MSNQLEVNNQMHKLITTKIMNNLKNLSNEGRLTFPLDYNVQNAVQAAYLKMKEVKDKNNKPALEICTQESIIQSIMNMAVQGLNPMKDQCYFIAYGNKLTMQRSYLGSMAVAKRLNPEIEDIYAEIVYRDDTFKMGRKRGKTIVTEHITALENIDNKKIIATYATALYKNGNEESVVMTLNQCYQAWKQSKMTLFDDKGNLKQNTTHAKFTEEMAKKTVINRLCKMLINTTDDSELNRAIKVTGEDMAIAEVKETIDISANSEPFIVINEKEDTQHEQEEIIVSYDTATTNDFNSTDYIVNPETGEVLNNEPEDVQEELF